MFNSDMAHATAVEPGRTRLTVDVRREQLLDAGVRLFASRAYEGVQIDEIARSCGVSRGLLYHYFHGKREFYVASMGHAAERLRAVDPDRSLPPAEQLQTGLEEYLQSVEDHPHCYMALRRAATADPEIVAIVEAQRRAFTERVLTALPDEVSELPLVQLASRAWIGAVEAASIEWMDGRNVPRPALVIVLAEALGATLRAAEAQSAGQSPSSLA